MVPGAEARILWDTSPLSTKNWAGPVKFDLGQVKIMMEGNFLNISGRLRENFSLTHCEWVNTMAVDDLAPYKCLQVISNQGIGLKV